MVVILADVGWFLSLAEECSSRETVVEVYVRWEGVEALGNRMMVRRVTITE